MDGPDAVRVLGRGAHQQLSQSFPRLRNGAANLGQYDEAAAGNVEKDAARSKYAARHQQRGQSKRDGHGGAGRSVEALRQYHSWKANTNRGTGHAAAVDSGHPGRRLSSPIRYAESEAGCRRYQRTGELHAARSGSAGELLGAVDGGGQSGALQRNVSSRIRTFAHQPRIPPPAFVGMATQEVQHLRVNRVREQPGGSRSAGSALAKSSKCRQKTKFARSA